MTKNRNQKMDDKGKEKEAEPLNPFYNDTNIANTSAEESISSEEGVARSESSSSEKGESTVSGYNYVTSSSLTAETTPKDSSDESVSDISSVEDIESSEESEGIPMETLEEETRRKNYESLVGPEFKKDFTYVKTLSNGVTGAAVICTYHGNDKNLQALAMENNNGLIVVKLENQNAQSLDNDDAKHARITYANEYQNILMLNATLATQQSSLLRPHTFAAEFDKKKFIFNEFVYFDKEQTRGKTLESYVAEMGANAQYEPQNHTIELEKLFQGMIAAQDQLHAAGLLHLDSNAQNFMLTPDNTVKIIDFGASLQMNKDTGKAVNHQYFPREPQFLQNAAAVRVDPDGKSLLTDVYARKVVMMESLGMFMGIQGHHALSQLVTNTILPLPHTAWQNPAWYPVLISRRKNETVVDPGGIDLKSLSSDYRRPVIIRQGDEIKIFCNANPNKSNKPEDWKVMDLPPASQALLHHFKFTDNRLVLMQSEHSPPTVEEINEKFAVTNKSVYKDRPVLIKDAKNPGNYWIYRYSESQESWRMDKLNPKASKVIEEKLKFTFTPDKLTGVIDGSRMTEFTSLVHHYHGNLFYPPPTPYDQKGMTYQEFYKQALLDLSDQQRLEMMCTNLQQLAMKETDEYKKGVVLATLQKYKTYLTTIPEANNVEELRKDVKKFHECSQPAPAPRQNHATVHQTTAMIMGGLHIDHHTVSEKNAQFDKKMEREIEKLMNQIRFVRAGVVAWQENRLAIATGQVLEEGTKVLNKQLPEKMKDYAKEKGIKLEETMASLQKELVEMREQINNSQREGKQEKHEDITISPHRR